MNTPLLKSLQKAIYSLSISQIWHINGFEHIEPENGAFVDIQEYVQNYEGKIGLFKVVTLQNSLQHQNIDSS